MRQIGLNLELADMELQTCAGRYHFTEENMEQLRNVYASMQLLLQCTVEYEITENKNMVFCTVTLGRWIDELQDVYERAGKVMAAYMLDCLAMEVLAKAYEQTAVILHQESGLWVAGYTFFGDKLTLEQMAEALKKYGAKEVKCNEVYGLIPQKSVVYMAELTAKRQDSTCHVCDACKNVDCPNRQVSKEQSGVRQMMRQQPDIMELLRRNKQQTASTYGMERIFGGKLCRD